MIPQYLIDAYLGFYEDDLRADYVAYIGTSGPGPALESYDIWVRPEVESRIHAHSSKQRLHTYLSWNGILGWTEMIFHIATTESFE